jgi:uncharacterized phage protein gp47/JayE
VSKTPADISSAILATLATTAPGFSCELGTPERKIIDACSEAISAAYVDQYLVGSLLDMDTKVGLELEQFVGIFGFGRLQGKSSVGVVRISMITPSTIDTQIPEGTQFFAKPGTSGVNGNLRFATIEPAVLLAGTYSLDIPVKCTESGTIGNLPPDSIVSTGTMIGSSSVSNLAAMTGGVDTESDAALRQRFKDTLLRNVSGTRDWYLSLCLLSNSVSRANVVGPVSLYRTQIEVPAAGASMTVPVEEVKYVWKDSASVFTNLGQVSDDPAENEKYYIPGSDFTLSSGTTTAPIFTRTVGSLITNGQVVDLEFQYTSRSSRNDPANNKTNKVDVFIDGIDPFPVAEQTVLGQTGVSTTALMSNLASETLYYKNFERVGTGGDPVVGSRFMRLGSVPVVSFPAALTINGKVYREGDDYYLIRSTLKNVLNETTLLTGSHREITGVEWPTGKGPSQTNGTPMTVMFVYNRVPEVLYTTLSQTKQIATDVLVHQADYQYIQPCLSIEYDRAYPRTVVDIAITDRLKKYFQGQGFGQSIKLSNICMAVQQVIGVVDVKVTTSAEATARDWAHYGIRLYNNSSDTVADYIKTEDFTLAESQVLMYYGVKLLRRATT